MTERAIVAMLVIVAVATLGCGACTGGGSHAPVPCGDELCGEGQLCATITAGHTCDTNDAGVGEYTVLRMYCMDIPNQCGDSPSCDCISGCSLADGQGRPCLSVYDGQVSCGCF